jgi:hypothetical protein
MDLDQDQDMLFIAREGLKSRLPEPWRPCQTADGHIFYFHFMNGVSQWEHPCDEHIRNAYQRARAKRDEPQRVITLIGSWREGSSTVIVRAFGTLSGEELGVFSLRPSVKVRSFRNALAKHLSISRKKMQMLVSDTRLVTEEDDTTPLASLMGIECTSPDECSTDERKRQRMEQQEQRLREWENRCRPLRRTSNSPQEPSGHAVVASAPTPSSDSSPSFQAGETARHTNPESQEFKDCMHGGYSPRASFQRSADAFPGGLLTSMQKPSTPKMRMCSKLDEEDDAKLRPEEAVDFRRFNKLLKSAFVRQAHHGDVHRQRPQSLRLQPMSFGDSIAE